MRFLDKAKIFLASGAGGKGCTSFRRERNVEFGGPNGGNGGKGGDVFLKATSQLATLIDFRYRQHFSAGKGQHGMGNDRAGAAGEDLILPVPLGTQVWHDDTLLYDLVEDGQTVRILKGGDGGFGNAHYKTSVNRAPRFASPGYPGQELWVWLRLKLLADIGLIGFPNAGKSTVLSVLTRAHPKIADYPFTTLIPQLGLLHTYERDYVLADLPGLIENAHQGKGLGHQFLGHVERCQALLHLIDATHPDPENAYHVIRHELSAYQPKLAEKQELLVLNKADLLSEEQQTSLLQRMQPLSALPVLFISAKTLQGIQPLKEALYGLL
jgi:GTP-binding protein